MRVITTKKILSLFKTKIFDGITTKQDSMTNKKYIENKQAGKKGMQ
jgi:hypothetical protein